jgi:uncharacterized membrane protein YqgA involved in biofilm formation
VLAGLGLVTLVIGVDLALAWRDTSALYVVGAVLLGGLAGEALGIATKALLDGFASIALAATLGWGVALSALGVLIYQGALSLGATLFEDALQGEALDHRDLAEAPGRDRREGRKLPAGARLRTCLGGDRLAVLESAHAGRPRSHVA